MPTRLIDQDDILGLIATSRTYGHHNPICMGALVELASPITDEDIERYASRFLTSEMRSQGYTEEDYEAIKARLAGARARWAAGPGAQRDPDEAQ